MSLLYVLFGKAVTDADLIVEPSALASICAALAEQPRLAVDTEFLRERTYEAQLALVQLAAAGEIRLLDPLAYSSLAPLAELLLDGRVTKVMHAARQDLEVLLPLTGRPAAPVLDTQLAAALVGLPPQVGYADLVERLLEVKLGKAAGANLARSDWTRRPLTAAQLHYAAEDVRYLLEIADRLAGQLDERGRLAWWREDCAALADPALFRRDPGEAWQRLKGVESLNPRDQVRIRALAQWREEQAQQHNLPRSWILEDENLRELAGKPPATLAQLKARRLFRDETVERIGAEILAVLCAAESASLEGIVRRGSGRPSAEELTVVRGLTDCLRSVASSLAVSPEVLATQRDLKRLALGDRRPIGALAGWRAGVIGEPLLARLASYAASASTNNE